MYLTAVMLQLHTFGYHNNCETIHDALEVPEIKADVVAVMKESAMAMTEKNIHLNLKN